MIKKHHFEIEQKYQIGAPQPILRKLRALKARKIASGFEINELYDLEGLLRSKGCVLRLRRYNKKGILTFKGPREKGKVKKRLELEATVPYGIVKGILRALGLRLIFQYSKTREIFEYKKTHVMIDHLPGLGWFVEIEGPHTAIQKTAKELDLPDSHIEDRTYSQLLHDHPFPRMRRN